jgi:hypothetical protein
MALPHEHHSPPRRAGGGALLASAVVVALFGQSWIAGRRQRQQSSTALRPPTSESRVAAAVHVDGSVAPTSDPTTTTTAGKASSEAGSVHHWSDLGLKALGTLAAGAAIVGFVSLVGGTVLHAQLSAAGIPADQAVSDLPRTALLGVGARILVPFLVALCVAFVVLFAAERNSAAPPSDLGLATTNSASSPLSRKLGVIMLFVAGVAIVITDAVIEGAAWWGYVLLLALSAVGFLAVWRAAQRSFAIFACVGVLTASLFATTSGYVLSHFLPSVRPVAVALKSGPTIAGIYAAANDQEVIIGQVCAASPGSPRGNGATGSLVVVPRRDVAALALGTNGDVSGAIERETDLLRLLPNARSLSADAKPRITPGSPSCTSMATARTAEGEPGLLLGP